MSFVTLGNMLGGLASTALIILIVQSIRLLLRHSVAVWAVRITDKDGTADYQFTFQNLEAVPISVPLYITLEEEGFPATEARIEPLFGNRQLAGLSGVATPPPASGPCTPAIPATPLRVYCGCSMPVFEESRVDETNFPARHTRIRVRTMNAYETWSIRLSTKARTVTMKLATPDNMRKPKSRYDRSFGLDLSVDSVELSNEAAVAAGTRVLPTWSTGITVACIGPLLYGIVLWIADFRHFLDYQPQKWRMTDIGLGLILAVLGVLWYMWVQRPVLPATQAYRKFWVPGDDAQHVE